MKCFGILYTFLIVRCDPLYPSIKNIYIVKYVKLHTLSGRGQKQEAVVTSKKRQPRSLASLCFQLEVRS